MDDEDIRAALRRGDDRSAFVLLRDRHGPALFTRCLHLLGDRAQAEDAFQDTMLKAHRARRQIPDDVVHLRSWLMRIASRAAFDLHRTNRRERNRREHLRVAGDEGEPSMTLELDRQQHDRVHAAIHDCLSALDLPTRIAYLRRHVDEAPWEEIAAEVGLQVDAIRQRVKRATPGLKDCLESKDITR